MALSRRDFLKGSLQVAGGLAASSLLGSLLGGCRRVPDASPAMADRIQSTFPSPAYQLPDWTGDSFPPMHRIRDHQVPEAIPAPSRFVDVAIIGGGLSGLATGFLLKEENILILERESALGGNAKSGSYRDVSYALGSAYLVDIGEPYGPFYEALGLTLKPVAEPVDLRYTGSQWIGMEGGRPDPIQRDFEHLKARLGKMASQRDFPVIPVEHATEQALKLDTMSFYQYLKADYSPAFLNYVDAYCYSALGGGIQDISAYAGINFYSEIAGPIYAFPGGNAAVAQRLAEGIRKSGGDRFLTGVSVYHIQQHQDKVHIAYFDNATLQTTTIEAKAVVCAAPYLIASRILKGLPEPFIQDLKRFQYGAYMVANCCFDRRVLPGGYDHWTPGNLAFTDFIDAGFAGGPAGADKPMVLTVYAPFRDAMTGRFTLLEGKREPLAAGVVQALRRVASFPEDALKEMRLTRYGHQLLSSRTGTIRRARSLAKQQGRIFLAHSDGQGMASIESALSEAFRTAAAIRPSLATRQLIPIS